ncbi:MAG TPA: DUF63 family protein [Candidatus Altiarchaeales archaeon]|nr:DUF63 family protein [Candidatus Altiarchaeales archaeon]
MSMGVYSPEDYIICIAILLFFLWFLLRYIFSRIELDRDFIRAISPYIPIGVFIRLLVDVGFFDANRLWNVTPGVYVLTIMLSLISVALGMYVSHYFRIPYWYVSLGIGILILLPITHELLSHLVHLERVLYPLALASVILFLVYLLSRYFKVKIFQRRDNLIIIFSHLLDGCATFIAYNCYGFYEEHLLPIFLISLAGNNAIIMVPVKLALILLVIYLIERWYLEEKKKDELLYRAIKFTIFILGMGPGLRDMLLPSLV